MSARQRRARIATPEEIAATGGDRLRLARERQGRSLSELSKETCIGERFLVALEQSDYSAFAGLVYIIGFARSYARALGLDDVAIVNEVRDASLHLRWYPYGMLAASEQPARAWWRRRAD